MKTALTQSSRGAEKQRTVRCVVHLGDRVKVKAQIDGTAGGGGRSARAQLSCRSRVTPMTSSAPP